MDAVEHLRNGTKQENDKRHSTPMSVRAGESVCSLSNSRSYQVTWLNATIMNVVTTSFLLTLLRTREHLIYLDTRPCIEEEYYVSFSHRPSTRLHTHSTHTHTDAFALLRIFWRVDWILVCAVVNWCGKCVGRKIEFLRVEIATKWRENDDRVTAFSSGGWK